MIEIKIVEYVEDKTYEMVMINDWNKIYAVSTDKKKFEPLMKKCKQIDKLHEDIKHMIEKGGM